MKAKRRPFPTFVIWLLVFMLSLLALLLRSLASQTTSGPPDITVKVGEQQLGWVVRTEAWKGTEYQEDPVFRAYGRDIVMPSQAAAGETVSVSINAAPDEVTLKEYALSADEGSPFGSAEFLREHVFYFTGRSGTFLLPEPGDSPVRGYVLSCAWGEDRCEYGFVIQITPE